MHACMHNAYIHTYMHTHIHMHIHMYMHACTHTHTHIHIHTQARARARTHTHTHGHAGSSTADVQSTRRRHGTLRRGRCPPTTSAQGSCFQIVTARLDVCLHTAKGCDGCARAAFTRVQSAAGLVWWRVCSGAMHVVRCPRTMCMSTCTNTHTHTHCANAPKQSNRRRRNDG